MANSSFVKTNLFGVLKLVAGGGVTLTVPIDKGNVAVTNLKQVLNENVKVETRGRLRSVTLGARIYPEVSFDAFLAEMTNVLAGNVVDFILKRGAYSGNVSTLGANHPVYAFHVELVTEGTNFGDDADMDLVVQHVAPTMDFGEDAGGNAIAVKGECLGKVLLNGADLCAEVA